MNLSENMGELEHINFHLKSIRQAAAAGKAEATFPNFSEDMFGGKVHE